MRERGTEKEKRERLKLEEKYLFTEEKKVYLLNKHLFPERDEGVTEKARLNEREIESKRGRERKENRKREI